MRRETASHEAGVRQGSTEVKDSKQGMRSWFGGSGNRDGLLYHLGECELCFPLDDTGLDLCTLS